MKIPKQLSRFLAALLSVGMITTMIPQANMPIFAEEVSVEESGEASQPTSETYDDSASEEEQRESLDEDNSEVSDDTVKPLDEAVSDETSQEDIELEDGLENLAKPSIYVTGSFEEDGKYANRSDVSFQIYSEVEGATILYTVDGKSFTGEDIAYGNLVGPDTDEEATITITARGTKEGFYDSDEVSVTITFMAKGKYKYDIYEDLDDTDGATASVSPDRAATGTSVTVTVNIADGYENPRAYYIINHYDGTSNQVALELDEHNQAVIKGEDVTGNIEIRASAKNHDIKECELVVEGNLEIEVPFWHDEFDNKYRKVGDRHYLIEQGKDFIFCVYPPAGSLLAQKDAVQYRIGDGTETTIDLTGWHYTIPASAAGNDKITLTINTVEAVVAIYNESESAGFDTENNGDYIGKGESYSFDPSFVKVKDGYDESTLRVRYNIGVGEIKDLPLKNGKYTVPGEEITGNLKLYAYADPQIAVKTNSISAKGTESADYVEFIAPDALKANKNATINRQSYDISFKTANIEDGYRLAKTKGVTYSVSGGNLDVPLTAKNGVYSIPKTKVTDEVTITVKTEAKKNVFNLTFAGDYKYVKLPDGTDGNTYDVEADDLTKGLIINPKNDGPDLLKATVKTGDKETVYSVNKNGTITIPKSEFTYSEVAKEKTIVIEVEKELIIKVDGKNVSKDLLAIGKEYNASASLKGIADANLVVTGSENASFKLKPEITDADNYIKVTAKATIDGQTIDLTNEQTLKVEPILTASIKGIKNGATLKQEALTSKEYTVVTNKLASDSLQTFTVTSDNPEVAKLTQNADTFVVSVVSGEKDKEANITLKHSNEAIKDVLTSVKLVSTASKWTNAKPIAKALNTTDNEISYSLTAPKSVPAVAADGYKYRYAVTYTKDAKNSEALKYTEVLTSGSVLEGRDISNSGLIKLIDAERGKGDTAKFTVTASLQLVDGENKVIAESKPVSFKVATKAPNYITKLSVVKSKAANGIYQGQKNVVLGTVKCDAKATYVDTEIFDVFSINEGLFTNIKIMSDYSIVADVADDAELGNQEIIVYTLYDNEELDGKYLGLANIRTSFNVKVLPKLNEIELSPNNDKYTYYCIDNKDLKFNIKTSFNKASKPQPNIESVNWYIDNADELDGVSVKGNKTGATVTVKKNTIKEYTDIKRLFIRMCGIENWLKAA